MLRAKRLPDETSERRLCAFDSEGFSSEVFQFEPSNRVAFLGDGDIDADGALRAYHPDKNKGLDYLANAGHPGNWWGLATDRNGKPFVQGPNDQFPGYFISTTAYQWPDYAKNNPLRYLDSEQIPFIVVEGWIRNRAKGIVLGCQARVTNIKTGRSIDCVVGDTGPLTKIGELSIAAARGVGLNEDPKRGGTDEPILLYELWPGHPALVDYVQYKLIPSTAA